MRAFIYPKGSPQMNDVVATRPLTLADDGIGAYPIDGATFSLDAKLRDGLFDRAALASDDVASVGLAWPSPMIAWRETGPQRRLAAIFAADAANYSRLMAKDEVETLRVLTA